MKMFLIFCLKLYVILFYIISLKIERKNIQMKEKLMIIIEKFLNLFSDWDFFYQIRKI